VRVEEVFTAVRDARPEDVAWKPLRWPPPDGVRLSGRLVDVQPASPADDAEELFDALDDDRVWQHVAGRPARAQDVVEELEHRRVTGELPWVVRLRRAYAGLPADTVVGSSCYLDVSVTDARLEIGSTAYASQVWGTAVNPDTKFVLFAYAFEVLGCGRVQLKTDVRNIRSQQAIARLGAHYEGLLRRYQRRSDGTVRDTVMFSVTIEDWPAVRDGLKQRLDSMQA
jgi:RimJ/RimL family protein N-acetyltransferase